MTAAGRSQATAVDLLPNGDVASLRTRTSRTYLMPNGSYQDHIFTTSINYQDQAGNWQPIDNTLMASSAAPGYAYGNRANSYQLSLPANLSDAPIKIASGSQWASFSLTGANATATVSGASATYADALPGADLTYTADGDVVTETITLKNAATAVALAKALTFTVKMSPGLSLKENQAGGIDFLDPSGALVFSFAPPSMRDSSATASSPAIDSAQGPVALKLLPSAGATSVALVPDATWLAAPGRVFPVVIDPSLATEPPTVDCHINSGAATTSYCALDPLQAGFDASGIRRTLVKFDLSSIPNLSVIENADVRLNTLNQIPASSTLDLERLTPHAFTSGATWNKYDGTTNWTGPGGDYVQNGSNPWDSKTVAANTTGPVDFYPTELVQDWYYGRLPNQGMLIKKHNEASGAYLLNFASSENTNSALRPQLIVDWEKRLGTQPSYQFEKQKLNDKMNASVNVVNGKLMVKASDLHLAGIAGEDLNIDRSYNSTANMARSIGESWMLSSDAYLSFGEPQTIEYHDGSGSGVPFTQNAAGDWISPPSVNAALSSVGANWQIKFDSSEAVDVFDGASGHLTSHTDRNGNVIKYIYTGGDLTKVTDSHGQDTDLTYSSGNLSTIKDPSSPTRRTYAYGYDANNDLTTYTDPANKITTYGYDGSDDITSITTPEGNKTLFTYGSGEVTSVTRVTDTVHNTGPTTTFDYNSTAGCPVTAPGAVGHTVVTDENSHNTTYCFDAEARVVKTIDALSHQTGTSWTSNSNVATFTDGTTQTATLGYDTLNNPSSALIPTGASSSATYNNGSHPHSPDTATDMQGNVWSYGYGAAGNLTTVTVPGLATDNQYLYTYNGDGTLATMTEPLGDSNSTHKTIYSYTAGDLTGIDYPGSMGDVALTYDSVHRLKTKTDGKGNTATYTYDTLNRVTDVSYTDPGGVAAGAIHNTFDTDGNVTKRIDPSGTYTFIYDSLNRQTKKTLPDLSTVVYGYDPASNLTSLVDSSGTTTYGYDVVNNLTSETDPGAASATSFTFDNANHELTRTYPNGVVQTITRDNSGRIKTIVGKTAGGTVLTSYTYTYKLGTLDTGLVQTKTINASQTQATADTVTYGYNGRNNLKTAASLNSTDYTYSYDNDANITKVVGAATTTYTYNNADALCWSVSGASSNACGTAPAGATTYTIDANGNETTSSAGLALTYNAMDQTTSIDPVGAVGPVAMAYGADTQDERVTKGTTAFQNNLMGVGKEGTSTFYHFSDASTKTFALTSEKIGSATYYYLYDGQGSVAALTNSSGTISAVDSYKYDPFGGKVSATGTVANPWRYVAQYLDTETGMYHMGARYYDPTIARFTQVDPNSGQLTSPLTLNRYLYANDNPINGSDPTGRFGLGDAFKFLAVAAAAASGLTLAAGAGPAVVFGFAGASIVAGAIAAALGPCKAHAIAGSLIMSAFGGAIGGALGETNAALGSITGTGIVGVSEVLPPC
jgi:RHS repeat-associated protein